MTPEQNEIVKHTWKMVTPIANTAADLFYGKLFELDPRLQILFEAVDLDIQKERLLQALDTTVAGLDSPEELLPRLSDLGRRHAGYGVVDSHYETVGRALLWTLQTGLQDDWTSETEQAWAAAYTVVSETMKAGARGDASSPDRLQVNAA